MNLVAKAKVQHIEFVLSEIRAEIEWAERFTDLTDNMECLDDIYNDLHNASMEIKMRHGMKAVLC